MNRMKKKTLLAMPTGKFQKFWRTANHTHTAPETKPRISVQFMSCSFSARFA